MENFKLSYAGESLLGVYIIKTYNTVIRDLHSDHPSYPLSSVVTYPSKTQVVFPNRVVVIGFIDSKDRLGIVVCLDG